jgi:predicted acyltransferase
MFVFIHNMSNDTLINPTSSRLIAIDAFRAIIMVLMIFVNDLWTLEGIPAWLAHVSAEADGMGLADIVFPAFLFIVGLSIPYAMEGRKKKGANRMNIFYHILSRTIALLTMGLFLVNSEMYSDTAVLPRQVWMILLVIAFFLIWMAYKDSSSFKVKILKATGVILLITLALLYASGDQTGITAMGIHWWGILGLIGWAYFIASSVYLFSNGRIIVQLIALLFFVFFNSAYFLGWLEPIEGIKDDIWIAENGAMPAFSMAGILTALAYKNLTAESKKFWIYTLSLASVLILFGLITRPFWGISKIRATPSWTTICSGIGIFGFLITVYITDRWKKTQWYKFIKPAGTSTLTAYLLPYIHYAIVGLIGIQIPVFLRTGYVGLGKSFIYALIIVGITGLLEKRNIRLKI